LVAAKKSNRGKHFECGLTRAGLGMHVEADLLMAGIAVNNLLDIEGKQRKKKDKRKRSLYILWLFISFGLLSIDSIHASLYQKYNVLF
jgi:hypothetical protein